MLVEPLLAEHHEVWVYSRRGYPGSEGADDLGLPRHAEDMWAVVEAAGGRAHVCGWSSGAMVAFLATQGSTSLRSVMLYEPPLGADAEDFQGLLDAITPEYERAGAEAVLETFLPLIGETDETVKALRSGPEVWNRLQVSVPATLTELRTWHAELEGAPEPVPPNVPTLYLYGEETSNPLFPVLMSCGPSCRTPSCAPCRANATSHRSSTHPASRRRSWSSRPSSTADRSLPRRVDGPIRRTGVQHVDAVPHRSSSHWSADLVVVVRHRGRVRSCRRSRVCRR